MPNAIVVHETGGPEKLHFESVPDAAPGAGQVKIRHSAIGVNFVDIYYRNGLYKAASLPFVPGSEGVGRVEAVGPDVTELTVGDRVAYAGENGAYAEVRLISAARVVRVPDSIEDPEVAGMMLKGITAEYLLLRATRLEAGDTIVFHAAAGGVGTIACQWARSMGIRVIGTAGGPDKVERAKQNGCDAVIDYRTENIVARVKALTHGQGVKAVFDSVGKDTFAASLDCLAPRGILVLFGQSSGIVPPLELSQLAAKGSLFVTRPSLAHYIAKREELLEAASLLFDVVRSGAVKIDIGQTYPLREAAQAHRDLEARRTTGSTLLLP